jgi:hypothetical protein
VNVDIFHLDEKGYASLPVAEKHPHFSSRTISIFQEVHIKFTETGYNE